MQESGATLGCFAGIEKTAALSVDSLGTRMF